MWRNTEARSCDHCLQWKSNKCYVFWVCVCNLRYPVCNAHAPYYIYIYDLSRSTVLFHISQTARFSERVTEHKMCVLIFSTTFVWNISHSKNNWAIYDKKVYWSSCKLFFSDFHESWIFLTVFRKVLKFKILWKSASGSRVVPFGRTDGRTDRQI